jgi:hypothetical protein
MYASDITCRNRAETLYINSVLKKDEFNSGISIRIDRQKGGSDYEYLKNVEFGNIINVTYGTYFPVKIIYGANPTVLVAYNMSRIDFTGIFDSGSSALTYDGGPVIDDGVIQIPTGGRDFYFFGTNYGAANNIHWFSNNALTFGPFAPPYPPSISKNTLPAILIGQYDRVCSALYYATYISQEGFSVITLLVYFSNYYLDTTNLDKGKYQIRLIRELNGDRRQWVEVTVISEVASPGYSNNPAVTYPSGTIDSDSKVIDPTKNSPYDITDGTTFKNVAGTTFSTVSPQAGTSFLYQSDSTGTHWNFTENAYVPV